MMRRSWSAAESSSGSSPVAVAENFSERPWGAGAGDREAPARAAPPAGSGAATTTRGGGGGVGAKGGGVGVRRWSHEDKRSSPIPTREAGETSSSPPRRLPPAADDGGGCDEGAGVERRRSRGSPPPRHRGGAGGGGRGRSSGGGGNAIDEGLLGRANAELEMIRSPSPGPARGEGGHGPDNNDAAAPSAAAAAAPGPQRGGATMENSRPFPPACRRLLSGIEGNSRCVDCGEANPEWASVSYGALLCLGCSGKHRSLGVKTSFVRSVPMDHWSTRQILSMLEGGNRQLSQFFARHALPHTMGTARYRTVAARFYREKLAEHVDGVSRRGEYRGRDQNRRTRRAGAGGGRNAGRPSSAGGGGGLSGAAVSASAAAAAKERSRSQPRGGGPVPAAKKEVQQAEGRRARSCSAGPRAEDGRSSRGGQLRRSVTTL